MSKQIDMDMMRKYITYNQDTGEFTWIYHHRNKGLVGTTVGHPDVGTGYTNIFVNGCRVLAHRLAWMWLYGKVPYLIDHINGIRTDNRISNLREVDYLGNAQNKKKHREGNAVGAYWFAQHNKWTASHRAGGKDHYLGLFETEQEAREAYAYAVANPHLLKGMKDRKLEQGIPPGIRLDKATNKWKVAVTKNKVSKHCGYFKTLEEAITRLNEVKAQIKEVGVLTNS